MNSPHHPHHEHHDVHQQRLLWFFSFCNQRSSSSSNSSSTGSTASHERGRRGGGNSRRKQASSRNKFAIQYQQQLQQQQRQSSNVFGLDLTEHTQRFSNDDSVPYIVKSCTRFIEKHGIIFGIYRLSGMRVNIHKLRQDFDKNPNISMIDSEAISNDAHAVACVLKQYFRELPTPLLTFHMYERFIELFKQSNNINNNSGNDQNGPDHHQDFGMTTTQANDDDQSNTGANNYQKQFHDIKHNNNKCEDINIVDDETNCDDGLSTIEKAATTRTSARNTSAVMPTTTNKATSITQQPIKSKSSLGHQQSTTAIATARQQAQTRHQSTFTTSASDSQLISLSSVVTTTTSDIKYQVKLDDLRKLLMQLPRAHYQTLKYLMRHLACIAANGQKTGMDSKNVAIVWAPNLLKPRELELSAGLETLQVIGLQAVITEQLIKHHEFLFDYDENKNDSDGKQNVGRREEEVCSLTKQDQQDSD